MPLRIKPIALPDLSALGEHAAAGPRLLPLDAIDEDPDQPRAEFDAEALENLAATIRVRGVLSPVSVRSHPREDGRWILNFGSRRLRASRLARREVIPAFVDETCDTYGQVIENEQREGLRPLELSLFIQRRKAVGESQAEIARLLGKSQPYVAMASALIDAPGWLMDLYRRGACRGLNELYQLRLLHERAPEKVEAWCDGRASVARSDVTHLSLALEEREAACGSGLEPMHGKSEGAVSAVRASPPPASRRSLRTAPALQGKWNGFDVEILTREVPAEAGNVFVRQVASGERRSVAASDVQLTGFERGSPG